jgi:hypothetical protein
VNSDPTMKVTPFIAFQYAVRSVCEDIDSVYIQAIYK